MKRIGVFAVLYALATFLLITDVATLFGKVKIKETASLKVQPTNPVWRQAGIYLIGFLIK